MKQYPEKTAKKRAGHIAVKETTTDETGASSCSTCAVKSNVKSIPGVMTARGCAYAGSKGVVWGPIRDMVHLSHGPVGCGYYSWSTRRNLAQGTPGVDNFVPFQFTSDYQERDIVYGGAQRLEHDRPRDPRALPAGEGDLDPVRVPDRPDRRRHRGQREEDARRAGHRRHPGALRGLPRRLAVARPPHRQRRDPRPRARQGHAPRRRPLRRRDDRRLQHRRRRLGEPEDPRGDGPARGLDVVRRRPARDDEGHPPLEAQPDPLLPLDELHRAAHGGGLRHPVDGVQLLRADEDRGLDPGDRQALRRDDPGQRREGHRASTARRWTR